MKTMKKAIEDFNRKHEPYNHAQLDKINSRRGYYRVAIYDDWGFRTTFAFPRVSDFEAWVRNVVFENEM